MQKQGIIHEITLAYTAEMNRVLERLNCTLVELVKAMLHKARILSSKGPYNSKLR
jgi:hypothetical protein